MDACVSDLPVFATVVPLAKAQSINALRAVFGEKYPDPVRVVSVGRSVDELLARPQDASNLDYSVELCGGTHLARSGDARLFVVTAETGVSQGVRRITAVTGAGAERVLGNARVARQMILDANKMPEVSVCVDVFVCVDLFACVRVLMLTCVFADIGAF